MLLLASFNYTLSPVAAAIGLLVALLCGWAWFWSARPWAAALCGGLCWSGLGGLVGLAGDGDMRQFAAIGFAIAGLALGIVLIGGAAALLRPRARPRDSAVMKKP